MCLVDRDFGGMCGGRGIFIDIRLDLFKQGLKILEQV